MIAFRLLCSLTVALVIGASPSYGEDTLPSDLISRAMASNKTILRVRINPITDEELEKLVIFFPKEERRSLNLMPAQVKQALRLGDAQVQTGEKLYLSESRSKSYTLDLHHLDNDDSEESPITSSAGLAEEQEYLYIVGQDSTINKVSGRAKARFHILSDFEQKGVFRIVPNGEKDHFQPSITEQEISELLAIIPVAGKRGRVALTSPKTLLGKRVAEKLATK